MEEFYYLNGYTSVNRYRKDRKGGSVSLHILQGIAFALRNDLDYFDSEMETVFIEIDKSIFNTGGNIVIGVIYRMPNSSVDVFNDLISDISNILPKSISFFTSWEIWILISWKLVIIEPRENYLMYCIAAMYFLWSRNLPE